MKKSTEEKGNLIKSRVGKKKILRSGMTLLMAAFLLIGFTYAWFINRNDIATLMDIREPAKISILGPDGQPLETLDLSYNPNDKVDGNVTIKKVFCVQSATPYQLEIAHTTNMRGLKFTLYPATMVDGGSKTEVKDGGISFYYDNTAINGRYINSKEAANDYNYANGTKHAQNYSKDNGTYNNVQAHAEPLYWLASETQKVGEDKSVETVTIDGTKYFRNYYVCEITWTETEKETDIFYILAQEA